MHPEPEDVLERLDGITDPCSAANGTDLSIVEMGLIDDVTVGDAHVTVSMRLTSPFCMQIPFFIDEIEGRVGAIEGVSAVTLETDQGLDWHRDMMTEEARERRNERKEKRAKQYRDEAARDGTVRSG